MKKGAIERFERAIGDMTSSGIELPSNRKFGFFFSTLCGLLSIYCYWVVLNSLAIFFVISSVFFLTLAIRKPEKLLPLNKLWMQLGLLLGNIVSPVVLGIIFFCVITPVAILMRLAGRDDLRLRFHKKPSYWLERIEQIESESFERQY